MCFLLLHIDVCFPTLKRWIITKINKAFIKTTTDKADGTEIYMYVCMEYILYSMRWRRFSLVQAIQSQIEFWSQLQYKFDLRERIHCVSGSVYRFLAVAVFSNDDEGVALNNDLRKDETNFADTNWPPQHLNCRINCTNERRKKRKFEHVSKILFLSTRLSQYYNLISSILLIQASFSNIFSPTLKQRKRQENNLMDTLISNNDIWHMRFGLLKINDYFH